jgi:hypothetical protein
VVGNGQPTTSEKKGCIYSPWGENDRLGRNWDFRLNSRLDRKSNRKFSVEIPVEPRIEPEIFGLDQTWNREQTEPAQKHVWALLSLSVLMVGRNRKFPVEFLVGFPVRPEI